MTALDRAKEINETEIISLFKAQGARQKTKGHTCCSKFVNRGLDVAVTNRDLDWIKTFLKCPGIELNMPNKYGYTPLNLATERGLEGMVEIFLADQRIDVNKNNAGNMKNALLIASEQGHVEIARNILIHNQTFVNQKDANGQSALTIAIKNYKWPYPHRYFQVVKLLLKCPKTETPTRISSNNNIRQLMGSRFLLMEWRQTCCLKVRRSILGAASAGDFRALRGLAECPGTQSNINTVDKKGRTPLYISSMLGHLEAVQLLVQNPYVDVNIGVTKNGGTAFSIASEKSQFNVLRTLIINGKSNEIKGWCSDDWTDQCRKTKDFHTLFIPPTKVEPAGEW